MSNYFDADEIVKEVTKGTISYQLIRDENGAGDVSFRIIKTDNEKELGWFYRDSFRDGNLANSVFNRIVRGEIRF